MQIRRFIVALSIGALAVSSLAKELKIAPQWTVIVLDEQGKPKAGCKVQQTWSYWAILEDQREAKITDEHGRVVFASRATSVNPVRLKIAQMLGNIPHAGAPAPAAGVHLDVEGYKRFEQYGDSEDTNFTKTEEGIESVNGPDGFTTTFRLKPMDLIDALGRLGSFAMAKDILARDPASAKITDLTGGTPLHRLYGHSSENFEIARLLVAAGADVNAKDMHGETPLHLAASQGASDIVELLLAHGSDPNARTNEIKYAPHHSGSTPLHCVFGALNATDEVRVIDLLAQHGADVNARDAGGDTPLHEAAYRGSIPGLTELITKGANVNARNNHGVTPLHNAAFVGTPERIKLLRDKGADVTAKKDDGKTPADLAKRYKKTENIRALQ